jgi:protein-tyrosine-phosphatase
VTDRPYNVLFLCTGNSARSILAEVLIGHWGRGRFVGYSAGSAPKGKLHPIALELLKHLNMPTEGLRSKSWNEFEKPGDFTRSSDRSVCGRSDKVVRLTMSRDRSQAHCGGARCAAAHRVCHEHKAVA